MRPSFFSWTWIGYFFLCGSLSIVWAGMALWRVQDPNHALIALGLASFVSGVLTGRLSPRRYYVSWMLAGILGALSVFVLLWVTPLASVASEIATHDWRETAEYSGGVVFCSMFIGACIGGIDGEYREASSVTWMLGATWTALGTLFACTLLVTSFVVNPETEAAFHQAVMSSSNLSELLHHDRLVFASALAIVGMAFLAGIVSQSAAPRRLLLASSFGAPLVLFTILMGHAYYRHMVDTLWVPALIAAGFAFIAAFIGAFFVHMGQRRYD